MRRLQPLGVIAPAITRWPSLKPVTALPSFSITPTGSCPMVRPRAHRIFALQDMDVGAADRRRGDPHQRVERADVGDRLVVQHDPPRLDEDRRFHLGHR